MSDFTRHIPPPCPASVEIVHADDDILVVDKPAGLLSVPGRYVKDCVLHRVVFDYPDVTIVHRLDLDTSGLMILALNKPAARELSRQFRERLVGKEYMAVVRGRLEYSTGVIDAPLGPEPERRPRHRVDPLGKEAITRFQVVAERDDRSLLRLTPRTGRSHQLRVHLAHIGHPILGCDLYADDQTFRAATRLLLHASALTFMHPAHADKLTFTSPAPFDC